VHRWQIGSVEIVRIEDESFSLPSDRQAPAWAVPTLAPEPTQVGIAFSAFAIADGDRRVVVDPWLANDAPRDRDDAPEHAAALLDELADAGFPAEAIDTVVNTHFDGVGWNTRPSPDDRDRWVAAFPAARYLYPEAELAAWHAGSYPHGDHGLAVLEAAGLLEGVALPHRVSPHVQLVDAPGHNVGHLAVAVEDGADLAVIPGHLFLTPFQVSDPTEAADLEPEVATASRVRLLEQLADRQGLLLAPLLGGPGGGVVHREAGHFALRP